MYRFSDHYRYKTTSKSGIGYVIITRPLCHPSSKTQLNIRFDITEFEKAIVSVMKAALSFHANGFVHCDIRWPNIVYDSSSQTYLLIDYENIEGLCDDEERCNHTDKLCLTLLKTPLILSGCLG